MEFRTPEDIINAGKGKFKDIGKFAPIIVLAVLAVVGLLGSIYSVGPEEVGVVQRFGRYVRTSTPGLHMKMPFGIEKVTPVPVRRIEAGVWDKDAASRDKERVFKKEISRRIPDADGRP
ncbi:SPFH domain-containing protein [Candidatus Omnitrophota bacterium]